jgi:hypothetical protein
MSNTCFNRFCILGSPGLVKTTFGRFEEALCQLPGQGEKQFLDFEKLWSVRTESLTFEEICDRRFETWGTRSELGEIIQFEGPDNSSYGLGCEASFHFETRITPVSRLAGHLSYRFPDVGIVLVFWNECDDLHGVMAFFDGDCVFEKTVSLQEFVADEDEINELLHDRIVSLEADATELLTQLLQGTEVSPR